MRFVTITVALVLLLAGCGGGHSSRPAENRVITTPTPDVAACETAMRIQYNRAINDPDAPSASRPPECQGIDDATVEQLAEKIMAESFDD